MKQLAAWACMTIVLGMAVEARAGCDVAVSRRATSKRVVRQVVVKQQAVAVVPFAVPVAVPVAVVARPAVFYGLSPYATSGHAAAGHGAEGNGYTRLGRLDPSPTRPASNAAATLVARSCVSCHGGPAPKAGLDLSDLGALTPAQRLAAVARVVSDDAALRMPPDRALAPGEIGAVLQELAGKE